MIIVPNEWLVDLLMSSPREQRLVHRFLDVAEADEHVLALRRQGRLVEKLHSAMRRDQYKQARRLYLMLWDSNKVDWVDEHEIIALPEELEQEVSADDRYLVETAFARRPCLLVTTDETLWHTLRRREEIQVQLLEEFLN